MDSNKKEIPTELPTVISQVLMEDFTNICELDIDWQELNGSTILVTGATGLIGSLFIRSLMYAAHEKQIELNILAQVRSVEKADKIFESYKSLANLTYVIGDIRQPLSPAIDRALEADQAATVGKITETSKETETNKETENIGVDTKIDYILHAASITASKMMVEYPVETLLTSIEGTKNLLELAKEHKVKSMIYVSSMEMYGTFEEAQSKDVAEDKLGFIDHLKVRSNYPESKRLCENMCIAYLSEHNVPVKIARLSQTFGAGILEGENRVFAQFARSAAAHEDIVLHTEGKSEGNYCYTSDSVKGLLTILLKGENGEAYNVVNPDTHTTIADMAHMVCENFSEGQSQVVFDIPAENKFGYAADTKLKLNADKLKSLGWQPQVDLKEAYNRLIRYMRSK